MSKMTRIISVSMMLIVLSANILAGCGNRHSDKTGLNKSDITETLSQTSESEKDSQMNFQSEDNTDTEITDAEAEDSGVPVYEDMEHIYMNTTWEYADHSAISDGYAVLYKAVGERKNIIVSTGGSAAAGAATATAVSGGVTFYDGTPESEVTFRMVQILMDRLLSQGYDVLMVRDGADVQLDNVARTVICNNVAACHISLHWDGDGLSYDKGCFYIAVPDAIKDMEPVATHWQQHNALGASLINGISDVGMKIHGSGSMAIDLTQTSYSTIPSVDMELGNASQSPKRASTAKWMSKYQSSASKS